MTPGGDRVFDVCVLGGGPAGAAAASLLASWRRSVVVIHRDTPQAGLAESLPASARKPLALLGLLDTVDRAGFHPNHGNVSKWAGRKARTHSDVAGYHVARPVFDDLLRQHAVQSGAIVETGTVRRVTVGDPASVEYENDGLRRTCRARFVLDCSGRAGIVARRGLRRVEEGFHTLALIAEWDAPQWPADERAETLIESYEDGWAWSVPVSETRRQCTVMMDPERSALKGRGLSGLYAAGLQSAHDMSRRLSGARQVSSVWSCDASLYGSVRAADSGAILVGDAASFIEPLSSAGVKKALTSAWRAAIVANTAIDEAHMWSAAAEYHDQREQQVYLDCSRRSAAFFASAASVHGHDFWQVRAACGSGLGYGDAEIESDPEVRAALARIREAPPAVQFRAAEGLQFTLAPAIEGARIVMRDAVMLPGTAAPVRFAGGANLPELVRIAIESRGVAAVLAAYHSQVAAVPVSELLAGLSLLVARGVLVEEETHAGSCPLPLALN